MASPRLAVKTADPTRANAIRRIAMPPFGSTWLTLW
jgi:hypothetical protein